MTKYEFKIIGTMIVYYIFKVYFLNKNDQKDEIAYTWVDGSNSN